MREMIKMVVALTVLSAFSGGVLAYIQINTKDKIEAQVLKYEQAPAIEAILKGCSNKPTEDPAYRFKLKDGEVERSFFVGVFDGEAKVVVTESFGKGGFGGNVGVMVGINVKDDTIFGASVTTHSETPGVGSAAKDDPAFTAQFKGVSIANPIKVTSEGGAISAISGATITSKAFCVGASDIGEIYKRLKPQIEEKLKGISK